MAAASVILARYKSLIRKLFPKGEAWRIEPGTPFAKLADALAQEPARIEKRLENFLNEMDPRTTSEMLDNWERLLNIPDECTPADASTVISDRRLRIMQKLTTGGGQNGAFYLLLAQQLGYDSSLFSVNSFNDFKVGFSAVGEALTNATDSDGEETGWPHTFRVEAPAEFVQRFRVGRSTVGQKLVLPENTTLECVMRKFAPAHSTVLFAFGE
jgi:uncharacterized protein YmfQ (DUF2313 family)